MQKNPTFVDVFSFDKIKHKFIILAYTLLMKLINYDWYIFIFINQVSDTK